MIQKKFSKKDCEDYLEGIEEDMVNKCKKRIKRKNFIYKDKK